MSKDELIKMFVETLEWMADIYPATGEDAENMVEEAKEVLNVYKAYLKLIEEE